MNKPKYTLMESHQDDIDSLDEAGMPLANSAQRIWNVARLGARELERNVSNASGQARKAVTAYADASNPYISYEKMGQNTEQINQEIKQSLDNIDKRYADALQALYQSLQLTDSQVFLFMLSPALYLTTKFGPQALSATTDALLAVTNQPNYTNRFIAGVRNARDVAAKATSSKGPGADQAASYSGGGYGAGDFGGDYGERLLMEQLDEGILNKIVDWAKKLSPQNKEQVQDAKALADLIKNPKMQQQIQTVAVDKLVAHFAQSIQTVKDPNQKKASVQAFFDNWKSKTNPAILQATLKKYKLL